MDVNAIVKTLWIGVHIYKYVAERTLDLPNVKKQKKVYILNICN